ncbi:MAG: rod shape-determining protein MreC [Alicyclobacillus herbarius]|uniref:rod shape-determining protein MreC n=1 Tax=Alicyclobacillus herbarius TaxID=122960 RepID=UPI00041BBD7C|nr:rod shape-determining protein MreC [Alicyclobacillus herbarius]MCL6631617.1 rod shape-determining protein MreC [Alicyclobacillus herbarius]
MSRLFTNRRLFILLAGLILVIAIAGLTLRDRNRAATWPERMVMDVQNTVAGWLYRPISNVTAFLSGVHALHQMYVENAQLQAELQDYDSLKAKLADAEAENQRLSAMLGFKRSPSNRYQLLPAHVIGRDPSQWNAVITIDVGSADGVRDNMPIVGPDGSLVGRVDTAARFSAKVILITDTEVGDGVSAEVQNGSQKPPFGVVTGSTGKTGTLQLNFLSPLADVKPGDTVVTSGLSTVYPPDIVIGHISSVSGGSQGLTQSATIKPSADLQYLRDVFVVKSGGHG